jgi:hypothetical protein
MQFFAGPSDAIGKMGSHKIDGKFFQQVFPEETGPFLVEQSAPFGAQVAPRIE